MKLACALIVAVLVAFQAASASDLSQIDTTFFPYAESWAGGDAAYSIPLDKEKTVWLFGDTFIGQRRPETMIHNSIAERTCQPHCTFSYWWGGKGTKNADAFFATPEANYFWPLDGFLHGGRLYIFLEQMHTIADGGPTGFDYSGVTLATVANPYDPPSGWKISYREIAKGNRVIPGIAVVQEQSPVGAYVYVFTLIRQASQDAFLGLLRMPLQNLSPFPKDLRWQYLAEGAKWLDWDGIGVPLKAMSLLKGNITEMSVKFHADSGKWVAIFPTPGFSSKTASFSSSKALDGPWTTPGTFFAYPEMTTSDRRHTPQVFCYAAKEHVELEQPGMLAFTYACNSMKEADIFRDLRLYRPQLVRMKYPSN